MKKPPAKPSQQFAITQPGGKRLQTAIALHQRGQFAKAEAIYRLLLDEDAENFDALRLLGTLAAQTQQHLLAIDYLDRAIALQPDHADAHYSRATALKALNRPDEALASYDRAIALQPDHADAHNNRGNVLLMLKCPDEALASYDRAIALQPDHAYAHGNRGNVLLMLKRPDEALASYDQAIALRPDHVEAHYKRGSALNALDRLEEALASYDRAIALKPDHVDAHSNRGTVLLRLNRLDEALASYDRAIALKSDHVDSHCNRGNVLQMLNRLDEALASYDRAIALQPDHADSHNNRGFTLRTMNRLDEALASYDRAIALKPDHADAHWNKSLTLLLLGDFEPGWRTYEWRWKRAEGARDARHYPQPLWLGDSDVRGRRILLWGEQGLGDSIQFCRHATAVAALGAVVILEAPAALARLLKDVAGVAKFVTKGEALPPFDLHCPLASLPLALKITLDQVSGKPYLTAPPKRVAVWRKRLGRPARPRVGLAWSGSASHSNDHNRSIPLSRFGQALLPGLDAIRLQKDIRAEDQTWLDSHPEILSFAQHIKDFADTAALIDSLDLVITVDTSVAHLAGALGKEVWILLSFAPDWRWLLDRADSPWYDSARLFRQPATGDWDSVMIGVRQALAERFGLECPPGRILGGDGEQQGAAPATFENQATTREPSIPDAFPGTGSLGPELRRRHASIAAKQTDFERWKDPQQLDPAWDKRAAVAAGHILAGARVLDLGCGAMALEKYLPGGCTYLPCDLVARDSRTTVCDLNQGEYPDDLLARADTVTMLGVIEYIHDVPALLSRLKASGRSLLVSYCPTDNGLSTPRPNLGWVNHYSLEEFTSLLRQAGFNLRHRARIDNVQWLFNADAGSPVSPPPVKRVLVLSYNNVGNFGDRLGYHLLNSVLPPHAEATYAHFNPWDVPADEFDLLVLGIGNSLFAPLLTDSLLGLIDRIPRKIGIFGTQYRSGFSAKHIKEVISRLDHWYARYEEDLLLYGRDSGNASHLGDWLIHACPLARASEAGTLRIGQEIWQDHPLDRTIQRIQKFRRVYSTRLHPLLCALTSAEEVAYEEQRESNGNETSGKFRSLLLDVFGREFPEKDFWPVDRAAVLAYKSAVANNMSELKARIETLL